MHGLWLPGEESLVLKHHLAQEFALELHWFRYFGASESMADITSRLAAFVRELAAPEVHFVGHSLGQPIPGPTTGRRRPRSSAALTRSSPRACCAS